MRLRPEKVHDLVKRALVEGRGSIVKGYLIVLDRDTAKEMCFLFDKPAETVRRAVEVAMGESDGSNIDGDCLERICQVFLDAHAAEVTSDVE